MNKKSLFVKKAGILSAGIVAAGIILSFAACGGNSDPFDVIDSLQEMMAEQGPGKGEVIAKVEDSKIYKNVFDMQVDMALKYSGLSPDQQLKERSDLENQKRMLESAVLSQAILEDMRRDPDILNDPEFIVFINMTLMQGLQQYYLAKKIDVDMEVTEEDIAEQYDELIKNPQYREQLNRMPKEDVDRLLSRRVLEMRQQQAMQRVLLDLQGKYRISKYEDKLSAEGNGEQTE